MYISSHSDAFHIRAWEINFKSFLSYNVSYLSKNLLTERKNWSLKKIDQILNSIFFGIKYCYIKSVNNQLISKVFPPTCRCPLFQQHLLREVCCSPCSWCYTSDPRPHCSAQEQRFHKLCLWGQLLLSLRGDSL